MKKSKAPRGAVLNNGLVFAIALFTLLCFCLLSLKGETPD